MTKLEEMLRAFERRNSAGKNGIYNIRCHQLHGPTSPYFLVGVRIYKCLVCTERLIYKNRESLNTPTPNLPIPNFPQCHLLYKLSGFSGVSSRFKYFTASKSPLI
ncbi:hypothetical protein NEUTE2DRAFT_69144 [Neurospora tetrasperma FGSC 2509]|nr:hypothetical protein NEUTE2DRAFT_69144 [Neurospora tetrasperma FGSC 2509]